MDDQPAFHALLASKFPDLKLYFRPPSKVILEYPCAVYNIRAYRANHANNTTYSKGTTFRVTLISRLPGYSNSKDVLDLPKSAFVTSFEKDDLVHEIFDVQINTT